MTLLTTAVVVACNKKEKAEESNTIFIVSFGNNPNIVSTLEQANTRLSMIVRDCNQDPLFNVDQVKVNPSKATKELIKLGDQEQLSGGMFSITSQEDHLLYGVSCENENR